tara:strand:+ start:361 stop:930 length:570 start_codon:yes stop_codon:yes gene_type:complete
MLLSVNPIEKFDMTTESEKPKTADDWFQEGVALGRLGHNGSAIQAYERAVELEPNHFKAYFNMAVRYGKLLMNIKAAESFRKALEIKPDDVMTHYSLAVISNLIGDSDEAFKHYEEAILLNPSFAKAYSNMAMMYYAVKQGRPTIENLLKARKLFGEQGDEMMAANATDLLSECYKEFGMSPEDFSEFT